MKGLSVGSMGECVPVAKGQVYRYIDLDDCRR